MRLPSRSNSSVPREFSSERIWLVTLDWAYFSSAAACVKLRWAATFSKVTSRRISTSGLVALAALLALLQLLLAAAQVGLPVLEDRLVLLGLVLEGLQEFRVVVGGDPLRAV